MLLEDLLCSRAPSLFGRYPASSLLQALPPPYRLLTLSRYFRLYAIPSSEAFPRGNQGFSSCLARPCSRAVATTPPECLVASASLQPAILLSVRDYNLSPRILVPIEATYAFTFVTARKLAHPAMRDFVNGLQKLGFPPSCHSSYGASGSCPGGLLPR